MIDFPGEKLVIRLWETLTEKGIGGLLRPWQMRREGDVKIELAVREKIALAQAEQVIEAITRERDAQLLALPSIDPVQIAGPIDKAEQSSGGQGGTPLLLRDLRASELRDSIRREVNVAKAIAVAEEHLAFDQSELPDSSVDPDWLHRWREAAAGTSKETLQFVWGQLLAGQVKQPGRYPLRLIDLVRSLDEFDAKTIEKLLRLAFFDFIFHEKDETEEYGLTLLELLHLESLGVIAGVSTTGLTRTWTVPAGTRMAHVCGDRVVLVTAGDNDVACSVPVLQLTILGQQLCSLGTFVPPEDYLLRFARLLKKKGFPRVELADVESVNGNRIVTKNSVEVDSHADPASDAHA